MVQGRAMRRRGDPLRWTRTPARAGVTRLDSIKYSSTVTVVFTPEGHNADNRRKVILENFDMSLGAGLSKLQGKAFRIGRLGSLNDLMLVGTLGGVEMGLRLAAVPHRDGGVMAALERLAPSARAVEQRTTGP